MDQKPVIKEEWCRRSWGSLSIGPHQTLPVQWCAGSGKKFFFKCLCGRESYLRMCTVTSGNTLSCGKCTHKTKEHWLSQKWGKLRLSPLQEMDDEFPPGRKKYKFICDCGGSCISRLHKVTTGHTGTCGKCSWKLKKCWLSLTWGSLKLDPDQSLPSSWSISSALRFRFLCTCGNTSSFEFRKATNGNNTTCGRCQFKSKEHWLRQRWGKLFLDPNQELPTEWSASGALRLRFLCVCGRKVWRYTRKVGKKSSCEHCEYDYRPKAVWLAQKWGKVTIDPSQTLPDEWGPGFGEVMINCECGGSRKTAFSNLIYGYTRSCGCSHGRGDYSPESELRKFVSKVDSSTYPSSYCIGRKEFDVYCPSLPMAIEHHGLVWHSSRYVKDDKRDFKKYLLAKSAGIRLVQIYGDEWRDKKEIMKQMIKDTLSPVAGKRVHPTFSDEYSASPAARSFLDSHHYLGAAGGCLTILARHPKSKEIIGVWVFMKREAGTVLWHRACWDHRYKAWNPHEKALKTAMPILREMGFEKILTFSDNRFHTGEMYEKIGFKFEKELKPDYSYTNGKVRKSKYALRVKAGVDEVDNAAAMGWHRIWDSGKKRFSLPLV